MANGIDVRITIQNKQNGRYYIIPVLPEKISFDSGTKQAETVTIIDLGDVNIPTGVELYSLSWDSFFPAKYDPSYCAIQEMWNPAAWCNLLNSWKVGSVPLQVVCAAMDLNRTMYLESMPWEFGAGPDGDIYYSLTLKELKTVMPRQLTVGVAAAPVDTKAAADRTDAPIAAKSGSYTVKKGDTLTLIAKNLGIADWRATLYEPNKAVIGTNPNVIKVGQVLTYAGS